MVSEHHSTVTHLLKQYAVLILIVVEYGLGDRERYIVKGFSGSGLNPYCSGIWSRRCRKRFPSHGI
mgnify:CR=1 FL=1